MGLVVPGFGLRNWLGTATRLVAGAVGGVVAGAPIAVAGAVTGAVVAGAGTAAGTASAFFAVAAGGGGITVFCARTPSAVARTAATQVASWSAFTRFYFFGGRLVAPGRFPVTGLAADVARDGAGGAFFWTLATRVSVVCNFVCDGSSRRFETSRTRTIDEPEPSS